MSEIYKNTKRDHSKSVSLKVHKGSASRELAGIQGLLSLFACISPGQYLALSSIYPLTHIGSKWIKSTNFLRMYGKIIRRVGDLKVLEEGRLD